MEGISEGNYGELRCSVPGISKKGETEGDRKEGGRSETIRIFQAAAYSV